jgi:hypothetical protein
LNLPLPCVPVSEIPLLRALSWIFDPKVVVKGSPYKRLGLRQVGRRGIVADHGLLLAHGEGGVAPSLCRPVPLAAHPLQHSFTLALRGTMLQEVQVFVNALVEPLTGQYVLCNDGVPGICPPRAEGGLSHSRPQSVHQDAELGNEGVLTRQIIRER